MNNTVLKIANLSKKYLGKDGEVLALDKVNLELKEQEFLAIVGPSGCGKSTLFSILSGIEKKSSGEIVFPGGEKRLGYMFQQDCLFPWLTILDNCLIGLKVKNKITEVEKKKAIQLLTTYGLGDFIYKYPNSLSGGMKQRVG